jgi:hypothetical protein
MTTIPSVRAVVARHAEATANNRVFFHPDIPEHRLASALTAYLGIAPDDVLVLLDNTESGDATEGLLLTEDAIHARDGGRSEFSLPLTDLRSVGLGGPAEPVLEINGVSLLGALRVQPDTMERVVAMLGEIRRDAQPIETGESQVSETSTRFCSSCGKPLPPGGKFCPACGSPASAPEPGGPHPALQPLRAERSREGKGLDKELFHSWVGGLMILGGLLLAGYFLLFFDTSVEIPVQEFLGESFGGGRVENIGLLNQRQNGVVAGFGISIVGAAIEAFARFRK